VEHICSPSTPKAEEEGAGLQETPGQHNESQKQKHLKLKRIHFHSTKCLGNNPQNCPSH
jgi:hypothetical protein